MRNKVYSSWFIDHGSQRGQALVTLLFFMLIGITITTASITVLLTNAIGTSYSDQGTEAYYVAESGAEDAVLNLLRNPNFTATGSGYMIPVGSGNAVVTVSNKIATSTGTLANTIRKIEVKTVYNGNILTISSWKEIK